MISAGSGPNRSIDCWMRPFTVSMCASSACATSDELRSGHRRRGELAERAVGVVGPRWIVGEGDRVDLEGRQALDGRPRPGMVVAEEPAGVGEMATDDLEHVAGEKQPGALGV